MSSVRTYNQPRFIPTISFGWFTASFEFVFFSIHWNQAIRLQIILRVEVEFRSQGAGFQQNPGQFVSQQWKVLQETKEKQQAHFEQGLFHAVRLFNDEAQSTQVTGRDARANSNANPLMLLASSVNTPIHNSRFHLLALCVRVRVLCGLRLRPRSHRTQSTMQQSQANK